MQSTIFPCHCPCYSSQLQLKVAANNVHGLNLEGDEAERSTRREPPIDGSKPALKLLDDQEDIFGGLEVTVSQDSPCIMSVYILAP